MFYTLDNIPIGKYLEYSLTLKEKEKAILAQLQEFLPTEIIDCHAHCNQAAQVEKLDEGVYHHMMSTFPAFTLEDSQRCKAVLYPGKTVRTLRFANAYRGINHRAANEYLLANSPASDRVALYGIPDDVEYTIEMLRTSKVNGLKMYYQYFNPPVTQIELNFPPPILSEAQKQGIPIILHLPKMITESVGNLSAVLEKFPRLTVVLAHLGLPHLPVPGLMAAYQELAQYPNLFMDTSMIPSPEVTFMAIHAFGASRILFGSDEPLNLVRSTVYEHPQKGQRLITEFPYHWVDAEEHQQYQHLAQDTIQTHWQVLQAIAFAVAQLPVRTQKRAVESIFYSNSKLVFGF